MGLSDEERVSKFFWTAQGWRKNLSELARKVGDERVDWSTDERAEDVVKGWISTIDTMVGTVHLKTAGGGSAYWLIGESDSSLRGLLSEPYHLRQDAEPESYAILAEPEYETVRWWSEKADHAFTASRLVFPPFKHHAGLEKIASWWDCYGYMSALSYPLNRYEDRVFPVAVHEQFTRLCGEVISRRFDVCFGAGEDDKRFKVEQYLLAKHNIFHTLLDDETKKRKGDAYFKKKFDGYALYNRVAKMSVKEMHDVFEAKSKAKQEWDRKYHEGERKKEEAKEKPDGLFGPPVPKEEPAPVAPVAAPKPKRRRKR